MAEYIDREALLKAMSYHNYYPKGKHFLKGIETAEEIIEHFPAADVQLMKWIPVTERLPEEGTAVNITWVNHSPVIYYQHIKDKPQTATGVYYRRKWYWWSTVVQDYLAEYGEWEPDKMDDEIEVTHWMPLPKPPKDGEA